MASYEVLAEESHKELLNLLEWFSHFSLIPTLIGGWAVFVYNSYFGSVDIDLVGPSMRLHNYEEVRLTGLGIETAYRKPITKQGRFFGYVEIDACTFEGEVSGFHEDSSKKLPYASCGNPQLVRNVNFDEKLTAYVPKIEPLI